LSSQKKLAKQWLKLSGQTPIVKLYDATSLKVNKRGYKRHDKTINQCIMYIICKY